jgi:uncharacterized phage protein (TIGR01671 family)
MREIKFRYKIKDKKELLYDKDPQFGYLQQNRKLIAGSMSEIFVVEDEQQYTGLKDKNSKEIYEGDIIKIAPDEYDGGCIGHVIFEYGTYVIATEKEKRNGIYWEKYRTWNDGMHDWYSLENTDCDRLEIVSHIFENPELINSINH